MVIATHSHQILSDFPLAEKKSSKFSKIENIAGWDNAFKKIAIVVANIFIVLGNWVFKPFSQAIKKNESDPMTIDINIEPSSTSLLTEHNPDALSAEEKLALKEVYVISVQCQYAKKYEEKKGTLPTEKHLLRVFNEKKLQQLDRKIERKIEQLTHEDIETIRKQNPSGRSQTTEDLTSSISFPGVLGFVSAIAATITTIALSGYANSWVVKPAIQAAQGLPLVGGVMTSTLHGAAVLNRGWNWGKSGFQLTREMIQKKPNNVGITGALLLAGSSVGYNGIKDYINQPDKAIINESACLTRQKLSGFIHQTVDKLLGVIRGEDNTQNQKAFDQGYQTAQKCSAVFFAINALLSVVQLNPF
jgi:hypothetical protein